MQEVLHIAPRHTLRIAIAKEMDEHAPVRVNRVLTPTGRTRTQEGRRARLPLLIQHDNPDRGAQVGKMDYEVENTSYEKYTQCGHQMKEQHISPFDITSNCIYVSSVE